MLAHHADAKTRVRPPGNGFFLEPGSTIWHACATVSSHTPSIALEIAARLVQTDADPKLANDLGNTPIHTSVGNHGWAMIAKLAELGADVNAANNAGNTPLHELVLWTELRFRHDPIGRQLAIDGAQTLIACGADPTFPDREGRSARQNARAAGLHGPFLDVLGVKRGPIARWWGELRDRLIDDEG